MTDSAANKAWPLPVAMGSGTRWHGHLLSLNLYVGVHDGILMLLASLSRTQSYAQAQYRVVNITSAKLTAAS
jgi:hypothetical protein